MTSPTDAQIEAVARACRIGWSGSDAIDETWSLLAKEHKDLWRRQARAAILAYELSKKEP